MQFNDNLKELIQKWEDVASMNHHKERDSEIFIEMEYHWGLTYYSITAESYLTDERIKEEAKTWWEVETIIENYYKSLISSFKKHCDVILKNPKDYEEEQVKQAEKFYEIFVKEYLIKKLDNFFKNKYNREKAAKTKLINELLTNSQQRAGQIFMNTFDEFSQETSREVFYKELK